MSTSKNLICIEEARTWVKKWQTDCPNNCKVHRDIVEDEKPSGCADGKIDTIVSNLNGSGVFDFTAPCPTTCDKNSPLFDPN